MGKKKRQGHYCRVCGRYRANEKFGGKGHARQRRREKLAHEQEMKQAGEQDTDLPTQ